MTAMCVRVPPRRPRWTVMPWPAHAPAAYLMADVSSNNKGGFNAAAYASAGHLMIAIKATQGTTYADPFWQAWAFAAHKHKLAVTHYHFVDGTDPAAEARAFWGQVRPHYAKQTDRLAVDLEDPALTRLGNSAGAWLAAFDTELLRQSGIECIGYTFRSALSPSLRLRSGKWWVAAWGNQWPAGAFRKEPAGSLWAWQFTDGQIGATGPRTAAGIPGTCDLSVLNPAVVRQLKALR